MTERELTRIKYLSLEIEKLKEQYRKESFINGMQTSEKINSSNLSNVTEKKALQRIKLEKEIESKLAKLEATRDRILFFIEKIEEPNLKLMVTLKYVDLCDDYLIADLFDKSTRTIRRWHNEFKKKYLKK